MKFKTALTSTTDNLEHVLWIDFEGKYFDEIADNPSTSDTCPEENWKIKPYINELFKQIKYQMGKEKINTSRMIIDSCPVWTVQPILTILDQETMAYFGIRITFSKVSMQCVAEVIAIEESSGIIEKEFENIQDVLNATFTKK